MKAIHSTLVILLDACTIPRFIHRYPSDVRINQAANGVMTGCDALAEMLESMEHFISRLRIYAAAGQCCTLRMGLKMDMIGSLVVG